MVLQMFITKSCFQFQQNQIDKYCRRLGLENERFTLPENETQRQLLFRHLIFVDAKKAIFCFVEKVGSTDMKRLMFVTAGLLPLKTVHDEWVDLKYLEKALRRGSFSNRSLTNDDRLRRIENHFTFMMVRNPLERLVSGFRNKIEPPLLGLSSKFPNYVKRHILKEYRPVDYLQWLNTGGNYNISISFPEFVEYVIDTQKEMLNPHFKPMIHTCHPCRVKYDFYGNFKMYKRDVKLVVEKLNMKLEYYPGHSLHTQDHETRVFLEHYYNQLSRRQKIELFHSLKDELLFYYYLYPEERDAHVELLGVHELVPLN